MAAGLGYKEFATGDVLTAADANGYLASQVVMVFASAAARTSAITSPQEGMFSYLKDTNSTEYYSGSAWVAVGGGGGGKVLQVVFASTSTATNIASTTYSDTGLSATITPTLATSKVLVIYDQALEIIRDTIAAGGSLRLLRGATSIQDLLETIQIYVDNGAKTALNARWGATYLDSPSTTSATTYKMQGKVNTTANAQSMNCQSGSNSLSTMTLIEIGA